MIEGTLIAESIRVGAELDAVRLVTRKISQSAAGTPISARQTRRSSFIPAGSSATRAWIASGGPKPGLTAARWAFPTTSSTGRYRRARLTPRQSEPLHLPAVGHANTQIARQLGISEATVRPHLENIYEKLGV